MNRCADGTATTGTDVPHAALSGPEPAGRTLSEADVAAVTSCMLAYAPPPPFAATASPGGRAPRPGRDVAATMALLAELGGPEDVDERLCAVLARGEPVPGFAPPGPGGLDHRVPALRRVLAETARRHGRPDVWAAHHGVCSVMLRERGRHAAVDLPVAAILRLLGLNGPTAAAVVDAAGNGPDHDDAGARIA